MKEELFESLVCSDKVEMLPNEQYFYNEADVRSAVMGLHSGRLRKSYKHVTCNLCKEKFYLYISFDSGQEKLCYSCACNKWFPVFFEDKELGGAE